MYFCQKHLPEAKSISYWIAFAHMCLYELFAIISLDLFLLKSEIISFGNTLPREVNAIRNAFNSECFQSTKRIINGIIKELELFMIPISNSSSISLSY